jgi:cytochrome c556
MFIHIQRFVVTAMVAAAIVAPAMTTANAQSAEQAIQGRKALMKLNGRDMRTIAGFLKKNQGTAADVAKSAQRIMVDTEKYASLFVKGTSTAEVGAKSRAKPEIWADMAGFQAEVAKTKELARALRDVANDGGDKGAIGAAMGKLGRESSYDQ